MRSWWRPPALPKRTSSSSPIPRATRPRSASAAPCSRGERQRLGLARALSKDPPIPILDEATSALYAAIQAKVQTALRNVMRSRAMLVIAHRLSTVRAADLILVSTAPA
jgi:ABC-type multidrug transport system fused ATPase/permease subunit